MQNLRTEILLGIPEKGMSRRGQGALIFFGAHHLVYLNFTERSFW
jgi:hypothetical protein